MHSKYKRLLSDTFLFTLSNFGSKVISFLLIPLYTSVLSTTDYGVSDLIQTVVNFLYPFLTLSISEATIRFAFEKKERKGNVLSVSLFFIIISTIVLAVATPLVSKINVTISQYWLYFLIYYFCFNIHYCFSQYTRGCEKTGLFAAQGILQTIVVIVSNIIFLLILDKGLEGYLFSFIIGYVTTTLFMIIVGGYWRQICEFTIDKSLVKEMLKYSIPMIPTQIFWWLNNAADKWIIIANIGIAENGVYSVAHKIPTILTMITVIFNQAWQVSAFSNYGEKDNNTFFANVYEGYWIINMFFGTILISTSEILGKILFSKEFYRGWIFVPILLIAAVFNGLSGMLAAAFTSAKKTGVLFVSTGIGAVINIVLNLIFIHIFGSLGAAYATAISCIVVWICRVMQINKYTDIRITFFKQIVSTIILIIQGVLVANQVGNIWSVGCVAFCVMLLINLKKCKTIFLAIFASIMSLLKREEER